MEKKIRVTLLKNIIEIIEADCESFKITKNYLINYIFDQLKDDESKERIEDKGEKGVLQFNLNKKNREIYYDILLEKNIQVEAEFVRNLIYKYAYQPKNCRELFVFKTLVERIRYSIDNNRIINISFRDKRKTKVLPFYIGSSKLELNNYLFCFDFETNSYKNYKFSNIEIVFITKEIKIWQDSTFVNNIIKNFSPFLSEDKKIKVKLTQQGKILLKSLTINRPKTLSIENDTFTFSCSEEQAKRYFTYFLDEVEIIEPLSLREWFVVKLKNALKKYMDQ